MPTNIFNIFRTKRNHHISDKNSGKTSFAQCGEDVIVNFIFEQLHIPNPTYLDLGAHHPIYFSNTYFFYKLGSRGVNVEPDPFLIDDFNRIRPQDTNLNVGVGLEDNEFEQDFFIMTARTLNTFSKEEAYRIQQLGTYKIEQIIKVAITPIRSLIEKNFVNDKPNFVSIDVEGIDFDILKSFDFTKYRPQVFCVETLTYSEDNSEVKENEIIDFMKDKDYLVFADTYINTIFVDRFAWRNR